DKEVTVGDTWSETIEIPTFSEPITTTIDSEVTGVDEIDEDEVFVIETTSTTGPVNFDLAEFLLGFLSGFAPDDASEDELAQMDALMEDLRFAISVDPQTSEMTTWFDHEAGLARKADFTNSTHMTMDISIPDETTGELTEMALDMTIDQDLTHRLVDTAPPA
ncbi:MAG TPA: hypothetical protein VE569_03585, partial [Acidimicrobiia bacterium]|nr:hypothetical protein [Acidimicrobiia bacterium]